MTDVINLLQSGNPVDIQPKGTSMYPLLLDKRGDRLIIIPVSTEDGAGKLKRGDILLYRSRVFNGLTVHRLIKKKSDGLYICGDNQQTIEGPVDISDVYGVVTQIVRKGKEIPVTNLLYRIYSWVWTRTIWFRKIFRPFVTRVHMLFKREK